METKRIYLASDDFKENQKAFESKDDCIQFCKDNNWTWETITYNYNKLS